jgi:hypothetical protein
MNHKIKALELSYLVLSIAVSIIIVLTPLIISSGISAIPEEVLEVLVITALLGIGLILVKLYRKEAEKNLEAFEKLKSEKGNLEERLMSSIRYIGSVNVQIDEVRSAFSEIKKYPESRQDFKDLMQFLGSKVLSMTDTDFVMFRIIDTASYNTLREYYESRTGTPPPNNNFSNKAMLESASVNDCTIVKSSQENFSVKTLCVINTRRINRDQEIFLKAIANQLEMLFLIFTSSYYRGTQGTRNNAAGIQPAEGLASRDRRH